MYRLTAKSAATNAINETRNEIVQIFCVMICSYAERLPELLSRDPSLLAEDRGTGPPVVRYAFFLVLGCVFGNDSHDTALGDAQTAADHHLVFLLLDRFHDADDPA